MGAPGALSLTTHAKLLCEEKPCGPASAWPSHMRTPGCISPFINNSNSSRPTPPPPSPPKRVRRPPIPTRQSIPRFPTHTHTHTHRHTHTDTHRYTHRHTHTHSKHTFLPSAGYPGCTKVFSYPGYLQTVHLPWLLQCIHLPVRRQGRLDWTGTSGPQREAACAAGQGM